MAPRTNTECVSTVQIQNCWTPHKWAGHYLLDTRTQRKKRKRESRWLAKTDIFCRDWERQTYSSLSFPKTERDWRTSSGNAVDMETTQVAKNCRNYGNVLDTKTVNLILSLTTKDCKILIEVLTGQCLTTHHAAKMGLVQSDACNTSTKWMLEVHWNIYFVTDLPLCGAPKMWLESTYFSSVKDIADKRLNGLLKLWKTCIKNYIK